MANIFISHRGCDSQESERLAQELRESGHYVWFDKWSIQLGDSIISRMNEGLEGATFVIICYSPQGIDSPWMGREWMSALARQLEGHNIKLIPVKLTGGNPPAILADIKWADLSENWTSGIAEILQVLGTH